MGDEEWEEHVAGPMEHIHQTECRDNTWMQHGSHCLHGFDGQGVSGHCHEQVPGTQDGQG
eukprot:gene30810-36834_t